MTNDSIRDIRSFFGNDSNEQSGRFLTSFVIIRVWSGWGAESPDLSVVRIHSLSLANGEKAFWSLDTAELWSSELLVTFQEEEQSSWTLYVTRTAEAVLAFDK